MWDNGLWYIICDLVCLLRPLTWPFRRVVCLWLGHDPAPEYYSKVGIRVAAPQQFGYVIKVCMRCDAKRRTDL